MMVALSKRFFPVIHCVSPYKMQGVGHALINARIAFDCGADGIFLIGHGLPYTEVLYLYEQVRKQFAEQWIGINLLDVSASDDWQTLRTVAQAYSDLDAIWLDRLPSVFPYFGADVEVFGGVAFKYIDPDLQGEELVDACCSALCYADTITTSGNKTGSPPDIEKLKVIRGAIGPEERLALASGVSAENVTSFKPYVDTYLVASSIVEKRSDLGNREYLVRDKVKVLATAIHG